MHCGFHGCYAVFSSNSRSTFVPSYCAWRRIASRSCCCSKRRADHWYLWNALCIVPGWPSHHNQSTLTCRPSNTPLCRKRNCRNQRVWRGGGERCLKMSTRRHRCRHWCRKENCYESMESEKHRGQICRNSKIEKLLAFSITSTLYLLTLLGSSASSAIIVI